MKKLLKIVATFKVLKKILKLFILSKLGTPGGTAPVAKVTLLQRISEIFRTMLATLVATLPK